MRSVKVKARVRIKWKCQTCSESMVTTRIPDRCPLCLSERDANHGPLVVADLTVQGAA